ncbi:MAG: MFS transporter [Chloroflexota bacterium]|nr:MFS transporter [Chloroflexota bacterium]MDE2894048.1 MFS transporter [Chloroflexota bacterium]
MSESPDPQSRLQLRRRERLPGFLYARPFRRVFAGWWIAAAASMSSFAAVSFFNPVLGAITPELQAEYGWSTASIALTMVIGGIGGGVIATFVGPIADRHGPRMLMFSSVGVVAGLLVALGFMSDLWQFLLLWGLGRGLTVAVIDIAVVVVIANWFIRRRGSAMGLTMIGTRSGMMIFPLVITAGIWLGGLREAFLLMALLVVAIGVLPPLIMRRRPEDVGLRPDGERLRASVTRGETPSLLTSDPDWTVREAVRTRAFWLLLIGTTILMAVGGAVNFTFVSHMTQNGIDADTARSALALWAGMGIVGGVLGGELRQRLAVRYSLPLVICVTTSAIVWFILTETVWMAFVFAVWHGLAFGAQLPLNRISFPDYFGRYSVGRIRSVTAPPQLLINAFGPFVSGLVIDNRGSYDLIYMVFVGLLLTAAISVLLARPPEAPQRGAANRSLAAD